MIFDLVHFSDPILHRKAVDFDFDDPPVDPIKLANDMAETMMAYEGVGLCACQVGFPFKVFVFRSLPPPDKRDTVQFSIVPCFNPRIVETGIETADLEEGCLSVPGLNAMMPRLTSLKLRYMLPNQEFVTATHSGMTARIIQHEYDHLLGKMFYDRLSNAELRPSLRKARANGFSYLLSELRGKNEVEDAGGIIVP